MHTVIKHHQIKHTAIALLIAMLFNVCNNQLVELYVLSHCIAVDGQEPEVLIKDTNENVQGYLSKRKASLIGI